MSAITFSRNDTIDEVMKKAIAETQENGLGRNILAAFNSDDCPRGSFAGAEYTPGDKYSIKCEVNVSEGMALTLALDYRLEAGQGREIIGKYYLAGQELTSRRFSDFPECRLPEKMTLALKEVGFTKAGGAYEILHRQDAHREKNSPSHLRTALSNVREDLALMARSLYSDEPSLVRYRRSVVVPDIVLVIITAATLEMATGIGSKAYQLVSNYLSGWLDR